jgi:hypothetical protein
MGLKTVPLYDRLPEIYRVRDGEQAPPDQLKAYLGIFEDVLGSVHENIEQLFRDIFIETCDDWVIPYIGSLLGVSTLAGDAWTLRADVADTIALRRRKGTLGAIELLAFNLTKWGAHCVELRENIAWHQHLNHQRPDAAGAPPYVQPGVNRNTVIRGGYVTLRDPAMLSLRGTPFDSYAYYPDVRPPAPGGLRIDLPNLAVFLWRLMAFRPPVSKPLFRATVPNALASPAEASFAVRFDVHPLGRPVVLFNTAQYQADRQPPVITQIDEVPGPIPPPRLTTGSEAGNPAAYIAVEEYTAAAPLLPDLDIASVGLQFHLTAGPFTGNNWTFRGANLCAWEMPLRPVLQNREIAIDPVIGRVVLGVKTAAEATALEQFLLMTYTYGAVGPAGAHPVSRPAAPTIISGEPVPTPRVVRFRQNPNGLRDALANLQNETQPVVIEIDDSFVHDLDIATVGGAFVENGQPNLRLNRSLVIRATSGSRPVVRLTAPLRFRPLNVVGASPTQQRDFDRVIAGMMVRLEGLYLARAAGFPAGQPLIARAAVNRLEVTGCTLEPDGHLRLNDTRAPIETSVDLRAGYGFSVAAEETAFKETPEVAVDNSITGPLRIDSPYTLTLRRAILDAGKGVGVDSTADFALTSATDPVNDWGPPTSVAGITVFGRMRVESASGRGGIWVHRLEVLNNQKGCIKLSYFSGDNDRLPQTFSCVKGPAAFLRFTSEIFGNPAYGQLSLAADFHIRERGPDDDQMGAFGFLLESHRWRNFSIRIREFMPVGVRPFLVPVT